MLGIIIREWNPRRWNWYYPLIFTPPAVDSFFPVLGRWGWNIDRLHPFRNWAFVRLCPPLFSNVSRIRHSDFYHIYFWTLVIYQSRPTKENRSYISYLTTENVKKIDQQILKGWETWKEDTKVTVGTQIWEHMYLFQASPHSRALFKLWGFHKISLTLVP